MRVDGRMRDAIREVKITKDYMPYAEGSCFIEMGSTKIVCTASIEEKVPAFLKGTGGGWITAEYSMLPRSCRMRVARESSRGTVNGRTREIQRLIGRSMRAIVDLKSMGERTVWIDCDVIQADGGTRTASITGGFVALYLALEHLVKNNLLSKNPVEDFLAAISVGIVEGEHVLDLVYEEDFKADVDMNIVMTGSGKIVEVQGTAEKEPFSKQDLDELIELASEGINELISVQKKTIGLV
ncbi:MAG: ribonuclease PH [Candidatus Saelkia tenebricola]|nr:ribonuclease PH [Candidatus Saelkia tenebricola]